MGTEYGCKVCRVLEDHDLEHYDERLLEEWRGDGSQRKGYRQLARWLNVTLLRREMDKVGLSTLGDEAESKYDRLREEGTTSSEVAAMLEREGIDVERLQDDFVSYGVVRTHLLDCLDAEYEKEESSEWEREAIEIARNHAKEKIVSAVRSLERKGKLRGGEDITVHVDVDLECESCQTRVPLRRAIYRGELCDCATMEVHQ
ncbi:MULTISPECIES: rod-determining factor RdfA [Natrialba]|uniref:Uncharacterized protein n=1 Tax=Natrialba swarupiae TaxID=2448032 RepID=A0A5D5AU40_9EURY|nr:MULTISPECIES: rod-determining factor RdfA [Natrialba]MWV38433.1 hypothetical protein [Natrialba sp. INN-245]TYT62571.1 hypothetical protein FYC77_07330 [Natrialba swarupiae]